MKKAIFILLISVLAISNSYSQKVIEMEYSNGVYYVPCKINDIPMKFIFDTGASNVSISMTEAMFLLKHGALKDEDLKESVKYQIANGEVQEGTKIIIREINVGGIILKDVEAGIVHQLNAPLLLGQSAISKLGKIELDGNRLIINSNPDSSVFLNIDFNKNLYEYEYNFDNNVFPLKISFKHLTKNTNHFLKGFGFDESAIFTKDGILTVVALNKTGNEQDLENTFVKVFKLLYDKYGLPTEKASDNKKFRWELKQYLISFEYLKDSKSLMLLCINPSKKLYIDKKLYLKDENTISEEKPKTKQELDFIHLKQLAEQGDPKWQNHLGTTYLIGEYGINIDEEKAMYWYKKSANQGYVDSQFNLAQMFLDIDIEKSFYWYKKSAEQNHIGAKSMLGVLYLYGKGTVKNEKMAFNLFKECAEQDEKIGQYYLGKSYYMGWGTRIDETKSAHWIKKSYENGYEKAKVFWDKYKLWKYE